MDRCSKFDTKSISEKISFNIKNLLELYSMSILELSNKTKISYEDYITLLELKKHL